LQEATIIISSRSAKFARMQENLQEATIIISK